jgi:hypothetical protein
MAISKMSTAAIIGPGRIPNRRQVDKPGAPQSTLP